MTSVLHRRKPCSQPHTPFLLENITQGLKHTNLLYSLLDNIVGRNNYLGQNQLSQKTLELCYFHGNSTV